MRELLRGYNLDMCWQCFGDTSVMPWRCNGDMLDMFWPCVGNNIDALASCWQCFGNLMHRPPCVKGRDHRRLRTRGTQDHLRPNPYIYMFSDASPTTFNVPPSLCQKDATGGIRKHVNRKVTASQTHIFIFSLRCTPPQHLMWRRLCD